MNHFNHRCIDGGFRAVLIALVTASIGVSGALAASLGTGPQAELSDSIKPVPAANVAQGPLGPDELNQEMRFMISNRMREYSDLLRRISNREIIPPAEMVTRYYPLESDYKSVLDWLSEEGITVTKTDPTRLGIFASGTLRQVQQAFRVTFVRVSIAGATYISAITAPNIPASLTNTVLGVNGLQPHIQLHKHSKLEPYEATPLVGNRPPFKISEIVKAYDANTVSAAGTGQKIAIVIDTFPFESDLTSFWSLNSIFQTLNNIEFVQVVAGFLPEPSGEETLDVEWASSIAPGAVVRVYGTTDLSFVNVDQAFQAIISDLPTQPDLHVVSISLGAGENDVPPSQLQTDAQYFATMAANGLSIFVSSGDSGSEEGGITQVSYFASDPSVTAVGGTSLSLNTATGTVSSETAWSGSGGGMSGFFARPAWQVGNGVPPGSTRLVPDIASAADPSTGALVILGGFQYQFGGTSWSAPMWAGFCALLNQARADAAQSPLGLIGPRVYPLLGSTSFRDITFGNNGAYPAGPGYDLCTGIGVPNVITLLQAVGGISVPVGRIFLPRPSSTLTSSNTTFAWSSGSATAYWLMIGDERVAEPGGTNILNSSQTGSHFFNVTGLPTDGRRLNVRLWSRVNGNWYSPPQDYIYTAFPGSVIAPVISPASGIYRKKVTVSIATQTPGATIYYTTNGADPTTTSPIFHAPFKLTHRGTNIVKAKAVKTGVADSPIATAGYTIR